jgi:hypothetical protein
MRDAATIRAEIREAVAARLEADRRLARLRAELAPYEHAPDCPVRRYRECTCHLSESAIGAGDGPM